MDQAGNREKSVSALDNYAAAIGELRAAIGANISIRRFGLLLALTNKPGSTLAELMVVTKDAQTTVDRKSVVKGKSVSVRVDIGGRRSIKKKRQRRKRREENVEKRK